LSSILEGVRFTFFSSRRFHSHFLIHAHQATTAGVWRELGVGQYVVSLRLTIKSLNLLQISQMRHWTWMKMMVDFNASVSFQRYDSRFDKYVDLSEDDIVEDFDKLIGIVSDINDQGNIKKELESRFKAFRRPKKDANCSNPPTE
uniref:Uncharacterized protein n=1 Tax=Amphimedon queenslandica TaxID=400682 RepID=A0A1X7TM68_AMPQE